MKSIRQSGTPELIRQWAERDQEGESTVNTGACCLAHYLDNLDESATAHEFVPAEKVSASATPIHQTATHTIIAKA